MESLSISPINLFLQAGAVGKLVMAALALTSVWCWVLIIEGVVASLRVGRALQAARAGTLTPALAPLAEAGRRAADLAIAGETAGERRRRIAEAMARAAREWPPAQRAACPTSR